MKILVITPYLPYANAPHGGSAILFTLLRELVQSHQIFLATMYEPDEVAKLDEVKTLFELVCAVPKRESALVAIQARRSSLGGYLKTLRTLLVSTAQYAATFFGIYARAYPDQKAFLQRTVQAIAAVQPDIIQIEYGYFCRLFARRLAPYGVTVGVAHDVEFKPALRMALATKGLDRLAAWMRYAFIRRAELKAYRYVRKVYALSAFDAKLLRDAAPSLSVGVRRSSVDTPSFDVRTCHRENNMILFVGALYRPENLSAVHFLIDDVMPIVWEKVPQAHVHLVGAGASHDFLQHVQGLPVVVHGYQERLADFYMRATLAVVPLFVGGGIIVKLLDALAYGVPTVASSIANEGVGAMPERDILIADDAVTFAQQILFLLQSPERRTLLSEHAYAFVRQAFNAQESAAQLIADYAALLVKS